MSKRQVRVRITKRKEDLRLLRGIGKYVGDIHRVDMVHAVILRSSRAHARLVNIDASAAMALPGVIGGPHGQGHAGSQDDSHADWQSAGTGAVTADTDCHDQSALRGQREQEKAASPPPARRSRTPYPTRWEWK